MNGHKDVLHHNAHVDNRKLEIYYAEIETDVEAYIHIKLAISFLNLILL